MIAISIRILAMKKEEKTTKTANQFVNFYYAIIVKSGEIKTA